MAIAVDASASSKLRFGSVMAKVGSLKKNQKIVSREGLRLSNNICELHMIRRTTSRPRGRKLQNWNSNYNCNGTVITCGTGMSLIFVASEVGPWSKTGGLGDVLGGLPPALAANGHRVMTVSPRYDQYKDAWDTEVVVELKAGDRTEQVRFFHCYKRGVDRVFVDHPWFLEKVWGKTGSKIYGPSTGKDYQDNQLRFSLLCQESSFTFLCHLLITVRLLWKHQEF